MLYLAALYGMSTTAVCVRRVRVPWSLLGPASAIFQPSEVPAVMMHWRTCAAVGFEFDAATGTSSRLTIGPMRAHPATANAITAAMTTLLMAVPPLGGKCRLFLLR